MKLKLFAILGFMGVITACNGLQLPHAEIKASFSDVSVEITRNATSGSYSVLLNPTTITFQATAGSLGAIVETYSARFLDGAGQTVSGEVVTDTLNVVVQPGRACADNKVGDECTLFSKGLVYVPGPTSSATTSKPLSNYETALNWLATYTNTGTPPGDWRIELTLKGKDSNGSAFSWVEKPSLRFNVK
jgi:hypothetical protein